MPDAQNALGEYLRARRELVTPDQVGIRSTTRRRVPGLRREEVAMLAGISAEYYLRLEQGRDRHPSRQVLEAVASVLRIEDTELLFELAAERPPRPRRRPRREVLPGQVARLVGSLPLPAFVEGRYLDVLAANALATAISPRLAVGRNRLRDLFLDPAEQALFVAAGEGAARGLIAGFRKSVGGDVDDPRVIELVGELSLASALFRRLWARHDVADRASATLTLAHPQVGRLRLDRNKLGVGGTDGIMLVVYQAYPDGDSAEKLALLGSFAATAAAPEPDRLTS